jgi:hypothetical protein
MKFKIFLFIKYISLILGFNEIKGKNLYRYYGYMRFEFEIKYNFSHFFMYRIK